MSTSNIEAPRSLVMKIVDGPGQLFAAWTARRPHVHLLLGLVAVTLISVVAYSVIVDSIAKAVLGGALG